MVDYSLCSSSEKCRASAHCNRNPENHMPERISERQSWASFHPTAGYSCPCFWDTRKDWKSK